MSQRHPAWLSKFITPTPRENDANDVDIKINEKENATLLEQAEKHRAIANKRLMNALAGQDGKTDEGHISQCQRIWVDACEVVVKAERLDAEQQRIRGQWASISDVSADLGSTLEHLRQMRGNLSRRVTTILSKIFDSNQLQQIQSAIVEAQSNQDAILRRLQAMSGREQGEAWLELESQ